MIGVNDFKTPIKLITTISLNLLNKFAMLVLSNQSQDHMGSYRSQLIQILEQGHIAPDKTDEALSLLEISPNASSWRSFIDQLLLWVGALAIALSVVFFIAYNWSELGKFTKFAGVELLLVLGIVAYWKLGNNNMLAKIALLLSSIFLGVLLALIGQTYQTGADPWQLFFYWSLMMLPWALIGRFAAIWLVWVFLINLSSYLYFDTFGSIFWIRLNSDINFLWISFAVNTVILICWEALSGYCVWLNERWASRIIAVASGTAITWIMIDIVLDHGGFVVIPSLLWLAWLIMFTALYLFKVKDLFMLSGSFLSGSIVITMFSARYVIDDWSAIGFFIIALLIIILGGGSAFLLKRINRKWQS